MFCGGILKQVSLNFFSAEKVEVQQQCEPAYQKHLTAAEDLRLPIWTDNDSSD